MSVKCVKAASPCYPLLSAQPEEHYIRLIELHKGEGPQVSCSIKVFPLDQAPKFYTLSYCWGDEEPCNWIVCNRSHRLVKPNLYIALQHLRSSQYTQLWIDAICIDQDNVDERSHQVNLMGEIYQTAQTTVVWLGPPMGDQERLVECLKLLSRSYQRNRRRYDEEQDSGFHSTLGSLELPNLGLPSWRDEYEPVLECVYEFYTQSWWGRTWVVQEFALSKHVVFMQGPNVVQWKDVKHALRALRHLNAWKAYYERIPGSCRAHWRRSFALAETRTIAGKATGELSQVLFAHRHALCSDARDRIFSMFGILARLVPERSADDLLRPDYGKPFKQVCTDFAIFALTKLGDLGALCFLRPSDVPDKSMASWVADFSGTRHLSFLLHGLKLRENQCWKAGGDTALSCNVTDNSLLLRGYTVDYIVESSDYVADISSLGPGNEILVKLPDTAVRIGHVLRSRLQTCPRDTPYIDGKPASIAFWRNFFLGGLGDDDDLPVQDEINQWIQEETDLIQGAQMCQTKLASGTTSHMCNRKPVDVLTGPTWDNMTLGVVIAAWGLHLSEKLARTRKGYYCRVPWNAKKSDSIILCQGVRFPLVSREILKPGTPRHHMIGGCYVYGMMRGELWDESRAEEMWFD